jgi:hypothetical protein
MVFLTPSGDTFHFLIKNRVLWLVNEPISNNNPERNLDDATNKTQPRNHMNTLLKRLRFVVALFFAVAVVACASGPKQVIHSFNFDGHRDANKWVNQVDLLEYSYGDQYAMVRNSLENPRYGTSLYQGKSSLPYSSGVSGPMPIGEFLYVKWRIKATGETLEERVDLRERLPKNMTNHDLTFSIDQKQLHVYVGTPFPRNPKDKYTDPNRPSLTFYKPTHLTWLSAHGMTYEIYPVLEPYPTPTHLTSDQIARCLRLEIACAADKSKK